MPIYVKKNTPYKFVLMYWNELLFTIVNSRILNSISLPENSADYQYKFWHLIYDFIDYQYPVYYRALCINRLRVSGLGICLSKQFCISLISNIPFITGRFA